MKILCVIPARGGSKGLPGKNFVDFCGRPLVHWPILYVKNSGLDIDILVFSDDAQAKALTSEFGNVCWVKRDAQNATDTATTESALREALEKAERKRNIQYDGLLFLTCTEIFRDPKWIKEAYNLFVTEKYDSVFMGSETYKNYWRKHLDQYERFDEGMRIHGNRQEKDPFFQENTGLLCFTKASFIRKGLRIGDKVRIISDSSIPYNSDVHAAEDLAYARLLLRHLTENRMVGSELFEEFGVC